MSCLAVSYPATCTCMWLHIVNQSLQDWVTRRQLYIDIALFNYLFGSSRGRYIRNRKIANICRTPHLPHISLHLAHGPGNRVNGNSHLWDLNAIERHIYMFGNLVSAEIIHRLRGCMLVNPTNCAPPPLPTETRAAALKGLPPRMNLRNQSSPRCRTALRQCLTRPPSDTIKIIDLD